jgi:hypothetical protein
MMFTSMRNFLCGIAMASMLAFTCAGAGTADPQEKKPAAAKSSVAPKPPAKKAPAHPLPHKATTSAGSAHTTQGTARNGKKPQVQTATWRTRQLSPTPDRYKEIQTALVAKGYLKTEDATGVWDQNSTEALKKFQAEQNLESSGKINSLSLIALGLGPRRDTAAVKAPAAVQPPLGQSPQGPGQVPPGQN